MSRIRALPLVVIRRGEEVARYVAEAGLRPARGSISARIDATKKEGAHGGTMGSPVRDESLYAQETFVVRDDPDVPAVWRSPAVLAAADVPLYPDGLAELLER